MVSALIWLVVLVVLAIIVIAILARFFIRTTREVALVRTGFGGRKVVMDGGAFAIPWFNEVSRVNMQTLPLQVSARGNSSLITKDRLRVDAGVEFYVSVIPTDEGVAAAQQTLGNRTFDATKLQELIGGKLVDALRSVAANFTMDDLHESRGQFVTQVREQLVESMQRNGLSLDTVSLTDLDQASFDSLDENNAFNAVGMRKLAEVIATSKKERAAIDANSDVSVRREAMTAAKLKLDIEFEEQEAQIRQTQKLEALKAAQVTEVVKHKTESELFAAQAKINMEQKIREADIARDRAIEQAEITQSLELEIANQSREIALAEKSQEESMARSAAEVARAEVIKATEASKTVRELAEAERAKQMAIVQVHKEAEVSGTRLKLNAQAEQEACASQAQTRIERARADAQSVELAAAAEKNELLARAEGQRAVIEAENQIGEHIVAMKLDMSRLQTLPKVVAEMVKPAEKIDSIKIAQINGLGSQNVPGSAGGPQLSADGQPVYNQALNSIMDLAVQLPGLKTLGEELSDSIGKALGKNDDESKPD